MKTPYKKWKGFSPTRKTPSKKWKGFDTGDENPLQKVEGVRYWNKTQPPQQERIKIIR
jgi:hypothetical protein